MHSCSKYIYLSTFILAPSAKTIEECYESGVEYFGNDLQIRKNGRGNKVTFLSFLFNYNNIFVDYPAYSNFDSNKMSSVAKRVVSKSQIVNILFTFLVNITIGEIGEPVSSRVQKVAKRTHKAPSLDQNLALPTLEIKTCHW